MFDTEDDLTQTPVETARGPRTTLWVLRIIALLTSVAVLAQPVLAGSYLDGEVDAIATHGTNGVMILGLIFVQGIAALIYMTAGRGKGWPLLVNVPLWFGTGIQIGMGHSANLAVHVPLGIAIVIAQLGITVWLFTHSARNARRKLT